MPHLRKSVLAITAIEKKIGVVKELRKNFQGRDDPDIARFMVEVVEPCYLGRFPEN
jgi:hypothetical protein